MTHLILPVAGQSKRFGGSPKFILEHHSGKTMLVAGIERLLDSHKFSTVTIINLQSYPGYGELEQQWKERIIAEIMADIGRVPAVHFRSIGSSRSEPTTVYKGILEADYMENGERIFIKDCDNLFDLKALPSGNAVLYARLSDYPHVSATNKSYIAMDYEERIHNIVEKRVISETFCVGGYLFQDRQLFAALYQEIMEFSKFQEAELYISHLVYYALSQEFPFAGREVHGYEDWGTATDWERSVSQIDYDRQYLNDWKGI